MKKIFFGAGVCGWMCVAIVSWFMYKAAFLGRCFYMSSWPFCQGTLSFSQHLVQGVFLGLFFVLISLPFIFLMQQDKHRFQKKWLLFGVLFLFFATFLLPFASSDVLYYHSAGRAVYEGINPYLQNWVIQKPFIFPPMSITTTGIMYGPIMLMLFSFLYGASSGSLFVFGIFWKLIVVASVVGVFFSIRKIVGFLEGHQEKKYASYLFLLTPLILFEWVGNGHFDGIWIITLLLAILFAIDKRWLLSFLLLSLGIVIKFLPIIVLPWFLLWWWQDTKGDNVKKNIAQLCGGAVLGVATIIIPWFPFWGGAKTLEPIITQSKWAVSSLFATLYYTLRPVFDIVASHKGHLVTTSFVQGALLLFAIYLAWPYLVAAKNILFRKMKWEWIDYVQAIAVTFAVYLLIWQKSFWPWYFSWIIPFLIIVYAVRPSREKRFILLAMGVLPLLFYIPWMIEGGDATSLPFFWYAQIVCSLPVVGGLLWWRQLRYRLHL